MAKSQNAAALAARFQWIAGGLSNPADSTIVRQYALEVAEQPFSSMAHSTAISAVQEGSGIGVAVSEQDLRHDADPTRLDRAMMKCQGWAPTCADMGLCSQSGDCFSGASCTTHPLSCAPLEYYRSSRVH